MNEWLNIMEYLFLFEDSHDFVNFLFMSLILYITIITLYYILFDQFQHMTGGIFNLIILQSQQS